MQLYLKYFILATAYRIEKSYQTQNLFILKYNKKYSMQITKPQEKSPEEKFLVCVASLSDDDDIDS